MRVSATLALFALALVATFALSFGIGRAAGPVGQPAPASTTTTMAPGMDMDGQP